MRSKMPPTQQEIPSNTRGNVSINSQASSSATSSTSCNSAGATQSSQGTVTPGMTQASQHNQQTQNNGTENENKNGKEKAGKTNAKTPGKSKGRAMTATEFLRKSRAKQRAAPKILPVIVDDQLRNQFSAIEARLKLAAASKDFMSSEALLAVRVIMLQLLSIGTEGVLHVLKAMTPKAPVIEKFPAIIETLADALASRMQIPWQDFNEIQMAMCEEDRVKMKRAEKVMVEAWKGMIALRPFHAATVMTWVNNIATQLNEKCINECEEQDEGAENETKGQEGINQERANGPNNGQTEGDDVGVETPLQPDRERQDDLPEPEEEAEIEETQWVGGDDCDENSIKPQTKAGRKRVRKNKRLRKARRDYGNSSDSDESEISGTESESASSRKGRKRRRTVEVIAMATKKIKTTTGNVRKAKLEILWDQSRLYVSHPSTVTFEDAVQYVIQNAAGPAVELYRELEPLIPSIKRTKYMWPLFVIAASGYDLAQVTCGTLHPADIKKAQGISTTFQVKNLLTDISKARPSRLNSRKAALFAPTEAREKTLADALTEKIQ